MKSIFKKLSKEVKESKKIFPLTIHLTTEYLVDVPYPGYKKQIVNEDYFEHANEYVIHNKKEITFPPCTNGKSTIKFVYIFDRKGRCLNSTRLDRNIEVSEDITPQFSKGSLTITED